MSSNKNPSMSRREMIGVLPATAWLVSGGAGQARAQVAAQPGPTTRPGPGQAIPQGPGLLSGRQPMRGSLMHKMLAETYQANQYALPALPYPLEALEPYLSSKLVRLHHEVHHQAYVTGLNRAVREMAELVATPGELHANQLAAVQRNLSFNGGGHVLHTVYWAAMGGGQSDRPAGEIGEALARQFGSMDGFRRYFSRVATTVKGSGWAVLMYEPLSDRVFAYQVGDHDLYLPPGVQPLLALDVWEHAYQLDYGPGRAQYVQAWWNLVDWSVVNQSYLYVRSLRQESAMVTTGR